MGTFGEENRLFCFLGGVLSVVEPVQGRLHTHLTYSLTPLNLFFEEKAGRILRTTVSPIRSKANQRLGSGGGVERQSRYY